MDMYQKRKMRKENRKKNNRKQADSQQVNINWQVESYKKHT